MNTIIFDLDGVLVDAKKIHYTALNLALEEVDSKYCFEDCLEDWIVLNWAWQVTE